MGIVGAGMSGIIAAHRLRQAGVEVIVFEKNEDVGGTWLENDYPGCRVDIQNHFYSYATAQTPDWPQYHSPQPVLLEYFRTCIERFGVADCIRYSTEVLGARWDENECAWFVDTSSAGREPETHRLDALVSATGQLNRPSMPKIKGIDDFTGPSFHSARWDNTVELRDKRVGVIGTGASAAQFIPRVAEVAAELVVFQRTPPWLLPVPGYEDDVSVAQRALLRHVPQFANWDRLWIFARTQEGLLPLATVDPNWEGNGTSVSAANEMLRTMLGMYYEVAFPDPELRAKMLPSYPPIAKRVVLDGGRYPTALQRDNVTVETTPDRRDQRRRHRDGRRRAARFRRHHLRHRLPSFGLPHAHEDRGHRRARPAQAVGRRRPGVPRYHRAALPEPLSHVRPEHEHRDQRQHHVFLRV